VGLLCETVELGTREQVLSTRVREFADELRRRPKNEDTLAWAAAQLREAAKQPARLGWDERLGILAVAMGTELSLYLSIAFGLPWLSLRLFDSSVAVALGLFPCVLLVPAIVGFLFRGGPAFWLTRTEVLRSDGRRATRWRCAARNLLAWTPMLIFYSLLGIYIARASGDVTKSYPGGPAYDGSQFDSREMWFFLGGLCGGELLLVLFVVGAIYALIRPQRGLQDLLVGTWLAPR
jgi:hypothetical protein